MLCPTRFRRDLLTNATGGPGNAEYLEFLHLTGVEFGSD
jgi:hypothetical protein